MSTLPMMPSDSDLEMFRNGDNWGNTSNRVDEADRIRAQAESVMAFIANGAKDPSTLSASASRRYAKAEEIVAEMKQYADDHRVVDRPANLVAPAARDTYREGLPLAKNQSVVSAMNDMGMIREEHSELSLSKYLKGALNSDWRGADAEREVFMSLSGGTDASGGILIPEILSGSIIDLVRNRTRVLQAGARVVPMANRKVVVPRWASDPEPTWRAEGDPFAEDDATMDSIELTAKGLGVVTKVTLELIEDTSIESELMAAFASAFALKLDWAALYADGTNDAPTGVKNAAGVTKTPLAENGAAPTWDALVDAVGRLRDVNEDPNAQIMSDRTARTLAKLKDADGQYLAPPTYLDGVTRYSTNQVPNTLDEGTTLDSTSDVFTGDWSQLYFGVRTALRIFPLRERYLVDSGEIGFVAHWRGDFAVARAKAFDVVTGVTA